jgi:hypothetical protein
MPFSQAGFPGILEVSKRAMYLSDLNERQVSAMADQHPISNSNQQSTPLVRQQKPRSFTEDLETVKRVGWFVAAFVGAGSLPAFAAKVQSTHSYSRDMVGVALILNFYFATFPLTTFATMAGLVIVREWYKKNAYICLGVLTFTLAGTTWLGLQWHDFPTGVDPLQSIKGSYWLLWVFKLLPVYWQTYGGFTFFACLVVGGFIAWAGGKMMWPYIVEQ